MSDQYPPNPNPQDPYGQQGQPGQPAYPQYPTYPGDQGTGQAPVPEKPGSVATAVKLMYVGAGLSLLSLLLGLLTLGGLKDEIEDSVRETDPNASQSTIDAAYTVSLAFIFLVGLVGVALWLWMAWKNGQGRSWARVVATILAVVNVLFTLLSLTQPGTDTINVILSLVSVVLAIVIVVFLWKPESTRYYEAVTRSRMLH